MTTFYVRRSVEKAFQLDEPPSGLTLNPHKPIKSEPPHITSAVDDIMYIVNKVLQQSMATSQRSVVTNVVSTLSRVLGSDFIGMVQRKMRDEFYPKQAVQGGAHPSEGLVISFLVLINNLDVAGDYIRRIVEGHLKRKPRNEVTSNGTDGGTISDDALAPLFPLADDAAVAKQTLQSLVSSFESKANDLLSDGIQVVFNNVVKHRLRPILADSFRDIEYQPRDHNEPTSAYQSYDPDHEDVDDEALRAELVRPRFSSSWNELLLPISRILTPTAFDRLLVVTLAYLARLLEKRLWAYHGRINQLGAFRLERDVSGVVNAAVDLNGGVTGHGATGRYRYREVFARCVQITMAMSMEEDEWEEMVRGGEDGEVLDKLSVEERTRARVMVRS